MGKCQPTYPAAADFLEDGKKAAGGIVKGTGRGEASRADEQTGRESRNAAKEAEDGDFEGERPGVSGGKEACVPRRPLVGQAPERLFASVREQRAGGGSGGQEAPCVCRNLFARGTGGAAAPETERRARKTGERQEKGKERAPERGSVCGLSGKGERPGRTGVSLRSDAIDIKDESYRQSALFGLNLRELDVAIPDGSG